MSCVHGAVVDPSHEAIVSNNGKLWVDMTLDTIL